MGFVILINDRSAKHNMEAIITDVKFEDNTLIYTSKGNGNC